MQQSRYTYIYIHCTSYWNSFEIIEIYVWEKYQYIFTFIEGHWYATSDIAIRHCRAPSWAFSLSRHLALSNTSLKLKIIKIYNSLIKTLSNICVYEFFFIVLKLESLESIFQIYIYIFIWSNIYIYVYINI